MTCRGLVAVLVACAGIASMPPAEAAEMNAITLQNDLVTYTIGADARSLGLVDKRSAKDYCAAQRPCASVVKGGVRHQASACSFANGRLTVQFGKSGVQAVIAATPRKHYFVFEVISVSDPELDELALLSLSVAPGKYVSYISGMAADDEFAACIRALNLQANGSVGGSPPALAATCYRKYGLVGAKAALVGCPAGEVRSVLKEVVKGEGLPWSPLGGPFALDAEENRGSYVFASVSEANVDDWIALARKAGLAEVHFIGWESSLGHYEPRKNLFPNGLAGLKATVDKLHAAGLRAGMHTLTGCISPHDPWATPVPDKRLAKDAAYTLAGAMDEKADAALTAEAPQNHDVIWAYASHGNVLRIGDELVQYGGLSQKPPFGFTGCKRGAFGTKAAPHAKGDAADHLYVRYTSFQPDEDTTLVDDVAAAIARVFDGCGFDMIYMDGAEGMMGGWHGVSKMRAAIFRKITRRVLVEASEWGYQSWPFHSRIGAWDHPNWGLKPFVDIHCRETERYRRSSLLPGQLGWWAILGPSADHRSEMPDEIEYLCCKALALDAPMSFQGISVGGKPWCARQDEYLETIGRYERLRLAGRVPDDVRARLREPKEEFRLAVTPDGGWAFVPADYAEHKVTGLKDGTQLWVVKNRFAAQPAKLRIEALYAAAPYEGKEGVVLADFATEGEFAQRAAAPGVTHALSPATDKAEFAKTCGRYTALKSGAGAWCKMGKTFAPEADLSKLGALGLWVCGDGKGELLNVQLTNPTQYWPTFDEHYVKVDFTGWRYVELHLRERDAEAFGDYQWPYGDMYSVYRSPLIRGHVSGLSLYLNNLPPTQGATLLLSPIKALPTVKVKLANPTIRVGGKAIVFPVSLESGAYIEFASKGDCKLYDERGAIVQNVEPQGEVPALASGGNDVTFACEGPAARAVVTVISQGEPFGAVAPRKE